MGLFLVYILKSSVCLAVFYLFYRLLLARETFHRFNRFALLGILLLSCLLPWVEVSVRQETEVHQTMLTLEQLLMMADAMNATETGITAEAATVTWIQVALLVYLAGIVFFAFRNACSLVRLLMLLKAGRREDIGNYLQGRKERVTLIVHNRDISPFSWMGYIVISRKDLEENGREILIHELAHIHNRHSWDLLVTDVCIFFQWFNPASWLLKQELQNIHEFEADETVIKEGVDAKQYQLLLIKKAVGTRLYSMANSFNHSKLKKRITMMYQSKSKASGRLRALALVPAFAVAAAVINLPAVASVIADASDAQVSYSDSKVKDDARQIKIVDDVKVVGSSGNVADGSSEASSSLDSMKIYVNGQRVLPQEFNEMSPDVIASIDVDKSKSTIHVILKKSGDDGNADIKLTGKPVSVIAVRSEKKDDGSEMKTKSTNIEVSSEPVTAVEVMPRYPGGEAEMMKFLAMNLRYPEAAMKSGKSGRVVVRFVVSKTGKVENPEIMRGISPELDAEALRVVGTLPDFIPGQSDGKPVACHYALPISFSLTGGDEKAANQGAANK